MNRNLPCTKSAGCPKRKFMKKETKIKVFKLITRLSWLGLVTGTFVLFAAGMKIKARQKCRAISIDILNASDGSFIGKSGISALIRDNQKMNPEGKNIRSINTLSLEKQMESDPWVKHAQVYMDNSNILHIRITQRIPLVRVFTASGSSFYLDSSACRLPLLDNVHPRLPLFTDYSDPGPGQVIPDSQLVAGMIGIGRYLHQDSFWNAQVQQMNILADGSFELIPRIGNQVILFGDGSDVPEKFRNLLAFYKEILNTEGWEKYDTINLSYDHEIVCVRRPDKTALPAPIKKNPPATGPVSVPALGKVLKKAAPQIEFQNHHSVQAGPNPVMGIPGKNPKAIYKNPDNHHLSLNTVKNNLQT